MQMKDDNPYKKWMERKYEHMISVQNNKHKLLDNLESLLENTVAPGSNS